jgi:hypothetical protein
VSITGKIAKRNGNSGELDKILKRALIQMRKGITAILAKFIRKFGRRVHEASSILGWDGLLA